MDKRPVSLRVYPAQRNDRFVAADEPPGPPLGATDDYLLERDPTSAGAHVLLYAVNNNPDPCYAAILYVVSGTDGPESGVLLRATRLNGGTAVNVTENGAPVEITTAAGSIDDDGRSARAGWLIIVSSADPFEAAALAATGKCETVEDKLEFVEDRVEASRHLTARVIGFRIEIPPVTVVAMPAGCGDCLVVEYASFEGYHRVLVDGGLGSAYERGLGNYVKSRSGQPAFFDIVVVSHVDRDHIDGVIMALERGEIDTPDIWFNGRDEIDALLHETARGVAQGDELSALIPWNLRNRAFGGKAIVADPDAVATSHIVGGASCTVLSPTVGRLERLLAKWPEPEEVARPPDYLLAALEDDIVPTMRGANNFGGDSSPANGSSIAVLLEVNGVSILLTGDAFANDLEVAIGRLLESRAEDRLRVDLFKLSHHGSRRNLTADLLALIEPGAILVCTDGSRHKHPDHDALVMVRKHYPHVPVYFSERTDLIGERAASIADTYQPAPGRRLELSFRPQ